MFLMKYWTLLGRDYYGVVNNAVIEMLLFHSLERATCMCLLGWLHAFINVSTALLWLVDEVYHVCWCLYKKWSYSCVLDRPLSVFCKKIKKPYL